MTVHHDEWRKSSRSGGYGGECVEVATVVARLRVARDAVDACSMHVLTGGHLVLLATGFESLGVLLEG
ncbi:DUF397 domain-containing protein [Actinoallomurus iriomotensis]|uniref:DUF397 domain-containing protein n=1 Tax=Actinoallomurus iriomotensis TaxID=478107 RepID=A0A9W6RX90_9ACTN|nr:hypothetical protein Airi01_098320 [Actinoallomurus iriomotensis]